MGRGSYTAHDWAKLKKSRPSIESGSVNQIFSSREMKQKYDPKYINKRESRDSEEHPDSTPIMIGVDVTGSMGYLSSQIIKESLNELMQKLYSTNMVKDPQLLFAAIGDVKDCAPLQVTQFESDIRIAEQLMDLWIEGCGGDTPEDFELLWYFADKHTETDCNNRGEKGFCFTIGDAGFHEELTKENIEKIFGDKVNSKVIRSTKLAENASEKYELFHIITGSETNNATNIIPGRVINVEKTDIKYLPEVIISAIQLTKGMSKESILEQWGELARPVVEKAISSLRLKKKLKISF